MKGIEIEYGPYYVTSKHSTSRLVKLVKHASERPNLDGRRNSFHLFLVVHPNGTEFEEEFSSKAVVRKATATDIEVFTANQAEIEFRRTQETIKVQQRLQANERVKEASSLLDLLDVPHRLMSSGYGEGVVNFIRINGDALDQLKEIVTRSVF